MMVAFVCGGASQLLTVGMGFAVRWKRSQAGQGLLFLLLLLVLVDSVIHCAQLVGYGRRKKGLFVFFLFQDEE